jgi:hypothetical protein
MEYGLLGLIVLVLDIFAILKIIESRATTVKKLVWILVILFLPVIGLILWWLAGPR